jgi:hypothetical protein
MNNISFHPLMQEMALKGAIISRYQESLKRDPVGFIDINLRQNAFRRVLDYLIRCHNVFEIEISVTEQRIAEDLGISLRWVVEAIKKIKGLGLINCVTHYGSPLLRGRKTRRGNDGKYRSIYIRKRRNVYEISKLLLQEPIANKLSSIFSGLTEKIRSLPKYIAISLLFVSSIATSPKKECQMEYCTSNTLSLFKDNHSLRRSIYQSRDVLVNSLKKGGISPMEDLSQKIAEMHKAQEPQHAVLKSLKAEAAREMSELLHGRVTATIHLSAKGQLHMMRYCDGALLYGLESLAHHGTIDNRTNYSLFEAACIEYSRRNEIEIDADKYDSLIRELGYVDSQPYCKKIILDAPLSKNKVYSPVTEKPQDSKPYMPPRRSEKKMYAALDPSLRDPIIALALRLGYEDRLDLPQISNEKLDLIE